MAGKPVNYFADAHHKKGAPSGNPFSQLPIACCLLPVKISFAVAAAAAAIAAAG